MDVDEEPSAYLNYLNDGDTPNTFFLGDHEPMFMDVTTEWPTEGFSVLETNPSVSEKSTQQNQTKKKAPLILTEENCARITTTDNVSVSKNNLIETCTIIAENGTEQTILVDKNLGVISGSNSHNSNNNYQVITAGNGVLVQNNSRQKSIQNFQDNTKKDDLSNCTTSVAHNLDNSVEANESNIKKIDVGTSNILGVATINAGIHSQDEYNAEIQQNSIQDQPEIFEAASQQINFQNYPCEYQATGFHETDISSENIESGLQNSKKCGSEFQDHESTNQLEFSISTSNLENVESVFQSDESAFESFNNVATDFQNQNDPDSVFHTGDSDYNHIEPEHQNVAEYENVTKYSNTELEVNKNSNVEYENGDYEYEIQPDSTTYINYDPIVKEKENGLREIYLTEKDIFNDAKVIQLLNSDGSIITIDKALLNSIDVYRNHKSVLKPIEILKNIPEKPPDIKEFFSTITAKKCKICEFLTEKTDDMIAHIVECHSDKLGINPLQEKEKQPTKLAKIIHSSENSVSDHTLQYLCQFCKEVSFSTKALRNEHLNTVHSREMLAEEKKKRSLNDLLDNLIKQQQKALKKYKCPIKGCIATLPTEELLNTHKKMHIGDKKNHFKCLECSEKFYAWRLIRVHVLRIHQQDFGTLICPMCSKFKTFSSAALRSHMNGHKVDDQTFLCPTCGKGFPSYNRMKNHQVYHKSYEDPTDIRGWPVLQTCDVCGLYFNSRKNLKSHIRDVHQNYRPYVCKICGHKTTRKAMLDLHIRQHTGIKPYKCLYCEFRSADHNCLRKHLMTHVESAKQYTCPYCAYSCIQTVTLKSHIRVKHPNRPGVYRCKYCTYTSINLQAYMGHEKSHELKKGRLVNQVQIIDVAIRVPDRENKTDTDEETQNCFYEEQEEAPIDTGGITIPAGFEMPIIDIDDNMTTGG